MCRRVSGAPTLSGLPWPRPGPGALGLGLGPVLGLAAPGLRGRVLRLRGLLRAAIQRHEHRQCPGPPGEGERHQDGQDDPFVPPAVGGVGMGRAHRVAMAPLAVDLGAAVLVNGVVARQVDGPVGGPMIDDEPGEDPRQLGGRPAAPRQDAMIAGGVAGGQLGGGAEQVGDGAAAGSEDGGDKQDQEALIGGVVEDRRERGEDGPGEVGYNEHEGHLVEESMGCRATHVLSKVVRSRQLRRPITNSLKGQKSS